MKKIFDIRSDEIELKESFWTVMGSRNLASLLHQWNMMEKSGIISNFKICSNAQKGNRQGYFYNDSDFYKWVEATSLQIAVSNKSQDREKNLSLINNLSSKLSEAISLIKECQLSDGYIFTYNQICSHSNRRWKSLLIEHEVYCMGHLIEAGVAHFLTTQEKQLIEVAQRSANLIIKEVLPLKKICGHPEIELALIKLYDITDNELYLNAAQEFVKKRNDKKTIFFQLLSDYFSHIIFAKTRWIGSSKKVNKVERFKVGDKVKNRHSKHISLKLLKALLSGSYFVTSKNKKKVEIPNAHAVRYLNFKTAEVALQSRKEPDTLISNELIKEYDLLLHNHLHIHGGIGDLPAIEGFHNKSAGNLYTAYCESCASASIIPLSNELFSIRDDACYADVIESELYNAIIGTFNSNGTEFHYRQPLIGNKTDSRIRWHNTSCCPSNISRKIADIRSQIYVEKEEELYIMQYISNFIDIKRTGTWIEMDCSLPFENEVTLRIVNRVPRNYTLNLRIPSWAEGYVLYINGVRNDNPEIIMPPIYESWESHHYHSSFLSIKMDELSESKSIKIQFSNSPQIAEAPQRANFDNKKAFFNNSMVYCYESILNPEIDFESLKIDLDVKPIKIKFDKKKTALPEEISSKKVGLEYLTTKGEKVVLTPYAFHGNSGNSEYKIWIDAEGGIGDF